MVFVGGLLRRVACLVLHHWGRRKLYRMSFHCPHFSVEAARRQQQNSSRGSWTKRGSAYLLDDQSKRTEGQTELEGYAAQPHSNSAPNFLAHRTGRLFRLLAHSPQATEVTLDLSGRIHRLVPIHPYRQQQEWQQCDGTERDCTGLYASESAE